MDRDRDLQAALAAASSAMSAVAAVGDPSALPPGAVVTKGEAGPATVADLASQVAAVWRIRSILGSAERVVAEESLAEAEHLGGNALLDRVAAALAAAGEPSDPPQIREGLASTADLGGSGRFWAVDPLDGTKGYLRGGHFAIAIALVEDGLPVVGVLAMPRLAAQGINLGFGTIAASVLGRGAWQSAGQGAPRVLLRCKAWSAGAAVRLAASVERAHSDGDSIAEAISAIAHIEPVSIDSQCKYALVARGDADAYVRLSPTIGYRESIWDHAAGALIAMESGCSVSDRFGAPLDFGAGRRLERNVGIACAPPTLHGAVLDALAAHSRR